MQHAQRVGSQLRLIGVHGDWKNYRVEPAHENESHSAEEEPRLNEQTRQARGPPGAGGCRESLASARDAPDEITFHPAKQRRRHVSDAFPKDLDQGVAEATEAKSVSR